MQVVVGRLAREVSGHGADEGLYEERGAVVRGRQVLVGVGDEVLDADESKLPVRLQLVEEKFRPPRVEDAVREEAHLRVVEPLARNARALAEKPAFFACFREWKRALAAFAACKSLSSGIAPADAGRLGRE